MVALLNKIRRKEKIEVKERNTSILNAIETA